MNDDACDLLCLDLPRAEALRARRLPVELAETAALRAKALADPTRLMLAAALRDSDSELCVCDLAWIAERSEKLVSHHVRALRRVPAEDVGDAHVGQRLHHRSSSRNRAICSSISGRSVGYR